MTPVRFSSAIPGTTDKHYLTLNSDLGDVACVEALQLVTILTYFHRGIC